MEWDFVGAGGATGVKCLHTGWGFGRSEFPVGTCPDVGQNGTREVGLESCQQLNIQNGVKMLITGSEVIQRRKGYNFKKYNPHGKNEP